MGGSNTREQQPVNIRHSNARAQKLIKKYQKNHRTLTQSRDDRQIRALFALYDKDGIGSLDEETGKNFIWDVLMVSELIDDIPEADRTKTVDNIFDELDENKDRMLALNEFLKPSWGKVQDLLNKAFIRINNLQQLPELGGDERTKENLLKRLDELEENFNEIIKNEDGDESISESETSSKSEIDGKSDSEEKVKIPKEQNSNDIMENDCSVCMDDVKNTVFIPCGHVSCCTKCATIIKESANPICPICDAHIDSVHHIFVV